MNAPSEPTPDPRSIPDPEPESESKRAARVELVVLLAVLLLAVLTPATTPAGEPNAPLGQTFGVLCPLRRVTDLPCGGCGLTRGFVQLAHGDPVQAVQLNPLTPLVFAWVLWRVLGGIALHARGKRFELPAGWSTWGWGLTLLAFATLTVVRIARAAAG